jgi:hypothetical protein
MVFHDVPVVNEWFTRSHLFSTTMDCTVTQPPSVIAGWSCVRVTLLSLRSVDLHAPSQDEICGTPTDRREWDTHRHRPGLDSYMQVVSVQWEWDTHRSMQLKRDRPTTPVLCTALRCAESGRSVSINGGR